MIFFILNMQTDFQKIVVSPLIYVCSFIHLPEQLTLAFLQSFLVTKSDGFYFWLNNLSLQIYLFSNGLGFLDAQLKENSKKGLRHMQFC